MSNHNFIEEFGRLLEEEDLKKSIKEPPPIFTSEKGMEIYKEAIDQYKKTHSNTEQTIVNDTRVEIFTDKIEYDGNGNRLTPKKNTGFKLGGYVYRSR